MCREESASIGIAASGGGDLEVGLAQLEADGAHVLRILGVRSLVGLERRQIVAPGSQRDLPAAEILDGALLGDEVKEDRGRAVVGAATDDEQTEVAVADPWRVEFVDHQLPFGARGVDSGRCVEHGHVCHPLQGEPPVASPQNYQLFDCFGEYSFV